MMTHRHIILTALGIGLATVADAQTAITISNSGYSTTLPNIDTAQIVTNLAAYSSLGTGGVNQNWDLSNATYSGPTFYTRQPATNAAFANAAYRNNLFTTFAGGLQYITSGYYALSGTGLTRIGEEVRTRQALPLGAVTGNNNDSVVFPVQTIPYTGGSIPDLMFPATMGSTWSSSVGSTLAFNLTVAMAGMNNTPGQRRTLRMANDTVVGWGRMRVLNVATGQPSGWMNVLQVRSRGTIRDSFFLNGMPAPATLLGAFNLQQGQITNVTYVRFFRAGEHTPLADMTWDAPSSAGAPSKMTVTQMRLASPASVGGVDVADAVALFPNPVRGGAVQVKLPVGQTFNYQIISVTGAVMGEGSLKSSATGAASVTLPAEAANGIYYLVLNSQSTGRLVLPFDVER